MEQPKGGKRNRVGCGSRILFPPQKPFHPTNECLDSKLPHPQSCLLSASSKKTERDGAPSFFLVRVDEIVGPCIGVPDVSAADVKKENKIDYKFFKRTDHTYMFVEPKSKWAALYKKWIIRECKSAWSMNNDNQEKGQSNKRRKT